MGKKKQKKLRSELESHSRSLKYLTKILNAYKIQLLDNESQIRSLTLRLNALQNQMQAAPSSIADQYPRPRSAWETPTNRRPNNWGVHFKKRRDDDRGNTNDR